MRTGTITETVAILAILARSLSACGANVQQTSLAPAIVLELHSPDAPSFQVKINGLPVPVSLDLGDADPLRLTKGALDAIKAVPTGQTVKRWGMDGAYDEPTYTVPRLEIGNAVFTNVVARLDAPHTGYKVTSSATGVLGTALLKPFVVVLDYPHRRMLLLAPKDARMQDLCRGTAAPFSVRSPEFKGEAVADVDTDMGQLSLWWDTGAQLTMVNQASSHATDRVISRRFILGGRDFGPYPLGLVITDLPFDGFIGDDFFVKHRVCIDYPGSRVVVADEAAH
jgi:hypothetical protein